MVELKACTKCGETKPATLEHFHKRKNGLRPDCKKCCSSYQKTYRKINKDTISSRKKQQYRSDKAAVIIRVKAYREANKEKITARNAIYYQANKAILDQRNTEYRVSNEKKIRKYKNAYFRERSKRDINFKLANLIRSRIWKAVKNNVKSAQTLKLLGCSIDRLKEHLAKQFRLGMSWGNYGEWHIDHIKPCALFDMTDPKQQKQCFNYSNLQPLWAKENMSKGAKYAGDTL